jgi:hypothetical protein
MTDARLSTFYEAVNICFEFSKGLFMEEGTFEKVKQSEERMYWPKGMIVCGYPPPKHRFFLMFMEKAGYNDRAVVFARTQDGSLSLKDRLYSMSGKTLSKPLIKP